MGSAIYNNSNYCCNQICLAMILSGHDLVYDLLTKKRDVDGFNPEPLREAQILSGMKILDLGCGLIPTFARCARKLGADVYTVDLKSAQDLQFDEQYFTTKERELEANNHVCGDLSNSATIDRIINISGRDFDLVTEAHLTSALFFGGKDVAMKVLASGGYWYDPGKGLVRKK